MERFQFWPGNNFNVLLNAGILNWVLEHDLQSKVEAEPNDFIPNNSAVFFI